MPIAIVKSIELVIETKSQPIKPIRIHVWYPYIIISNVEHKYRECPNKIEV